MTLQGIYDAKHWRDRAAEMRVLSADMKDLEARTLMLKLARPPSALPGRCSPHWFLSACLTANSFCEQKSWLSKA
jgi:hypothetical protein